MKEDKLKYSYLTPTAATLDALYHVHDMGMSWADISLAFDKSAFLRDLFNDDEGFMGVSMLSNFYADMFNHFQEALQL